MGWRKMLETEHRLLIEVGEAANRESARIEATGEIRTELAEDILGFYRYFADGLHDPKEEALLYSRCYKRGMTDEDEPLGQMIGEHEWCRGQLDLVDRALRTYTPGDRDTALEFAQGLRDYVEVVGCHIDVEEDFFFEMAQRYLSEDDQRALDEEFVNASWDETEEGVVAYWVELAHRVAAETAPTT